MNTVADAMSIIKDYHLMKLTSLEPTLCFLYNVKNISINNINLLLDNNISINNLSSINNYMMERRSRSNSQQNLNNIVESNTTTTTTTVGSDATINTVRTHPITTIWDYYTCYDGKDINTNDDELLCVLCLGKIEYHNPLSFTGFCNHSFHIECVLNLESPQCPVCRFQHDSDDNFFSVCHVCEWNGSTSNSSNSNNNSIITAASSDDNSPCRDLWICLVCGFIGCGSKHYFHIKEHYLTHLHTYAMNVESRRVWDFAGDGYVHRLIYNNNNKMIEHNNNNNYSNNNNNNNNNMSLYRSHHPPINDEEEELIINNKLESIAFHYNQLVSLTLQQSRDEYQRKLLRFQEFIQTELNSQKIKLLINLEKNKVEKTNISLKEKLSLLRKEYENLIELNKNCLLNKEELNNNMKMEKEKFSKNKINFLNNITRLERKVNDLMKQLE
jgi:BRCA1-associated protein